MKTYAPEKIRNIGIVAHSGAGKTSLAEAILYDSGTVNRLGKVGDGSTVMDYDPEEIKREMSISASLASAVWKDHKINIIDTPGDQNFIAEALLSMSVMDTAVVIVSAVSGIKVQTEKVWGWACDHDLPRVIFINKMDNEKASFQNAFDQIDDRFHQKTLKFTLPIGSGAEFKGVVDLLYMKAYIYQLDGEGTFTTEEIPDELKEWAEKERREMVESVAETDEELLEKYMESDTLSDEDLFSGLRSSIVSGDVVPVLCGSATANIVVRKTLDTIVNFLPSPADMPPKKGVDDKGAEITVKQDPNGPEVAQIFKTVADPYAGKLSLFRVFSGEIISDSSLVNASKDEAKERLGQLLSINGKKHNLVKKVTLGDIGAVAKLKSAQTGDTLCNSKYLASLMREQPPKPMVAVAIEPESQGDDDKLMSSLKRLGEEDPTLSVDLDPATGEMILQGMGQVHIDVTLNRLKEKFGINVATHPPKIAYKEAIRGSSKGHGRLKKQSGGHGQFADCWIEVEPLTNGEVFEFVNAIVGGVIPRQYIPGVEKGVKEAMGSGVLAGYPVTGCKVTVYDGKHHDVDSSEMAFKTAASMAFKDAVTQAKPVLLEPVMELEVVAPDECIGDIMADLSQKRGKVLGMGVMGGQQRVNATAPLSEVLTYEQDINSMTGGRGQFTMEFSSYEQAPSNVTKKIIEEAKAAAEER